MHTERVMYVLAALTAALSCGAQPEVSELYVHVRVFTPLIVSKRLQLRPLTTAVLLGAVNLRRYENIGKELTMLVSLKRLS